MGLTTKQVALLSANGVNPAYAGASVALDFAGLTPTGRPYYYVNGVISPTFAGLPGLTVTRASGGYAEDTSGNLIWFNSGQARITNKGLLVEEARTNLLLYSQQFDNAAWGKSDTTVTADQALAPDGTNTADLITEGSAGTAQVNQAVTITAGQTLSVARYFKRGNTDWVLIKVDSTGGANGFGQWFNLSTGAKGNQYSFGTGTFLSATISQASNGFYRCVVTGTVDAAATTAAVRTFNTSATNVETRVSGATRYEWQADVQAGSFITSPIPTTSATVTRAADDIHFDGAMPQTPTVWADALFPADDAAANKSVFSLSVGADNSNRIYSYKTTGGALQAQIISGGSSTFGPNTPLPGAKVGSVAISFDGTSGLASVNGFALTSSAQTPPVGTLSRLALGARADGAIQLNGYIRRLVLYPAALGQTQLNALTSGADPSTLRLDFAAGSYKNAAGYVRTNWVRNSTMVGAAAGTPGTMPTGWVLNVNTPGLSSSVVGTGVEGGRNYIDWRLAGTATTTSTSSLWFGGISDTAAAASQNWTVSSYVRLVGGSLTNVSNVILNGGVSTNGSTISSTFGTNGFTPTATVTRFWASGATGASTTSVLAYLQINPAIGAIDVTLRIYQPQLEQTNYPTSDIATAGAAVSTTTYSSTNPADVGNLTFTRASTGYATDASGNLIAFPANVPRITSAGLLIEESRTNLVIYSSGYTSWATTSTTVTNNAGIAPDGTNTADKIVVNAGSNNNWAAQRGTATIANATVYTTSFYAKPIGYTRLQIAGAVFNGGAWPDTLFDLTNNTVVAGGAAVTFTFTPLANGWVRIAGTWTSTGAGNPNLYVHFVPASVTGVNQTYVADGVSGGYLWGLQSEQGAFATSFISTTSGPATRAADVFSYPQTYTTAGMIAASALVGQSAGGSPRIVGGQSAVTALYQGSTAYGTYNGMTSLQKTVTVGAVGTPVSAAVSWDASSRKVSVNGSATASDASGIGTLSTMYLGSDSGTSNFWNNVISRVAIYPYLANDNELLYRSGGSF